MCKNPNNFLYNPGHMILWCEEVGPVANAKEGSIQEHYWARVGTGKYCVTCVVHMVD